VFPEIEPWPEPVEGAELLDAMTAHLQRFAVMPSSHATTAICLFALHCHAIDAATHTPRLLITSPTRECGKSQVMEWLAGVVPRPFDVIDPTGPTLFRPIEAHQPTVLIDEGDLVSWDERRDVRMVINAGHNRFSPGVPRCVGEDNEPRMFRVWAPLAYAMIGKPLDTQLSRSIVIPMRRMAPDQRPEYRRIDRDQGFSELQRKCTRWAADHIDALRASDPELPLTGRKANCWRPLCAIADAASGNWPDKARAAAKALSDIDADAEAIGVQLLADMQIVFDTTKAEAIWTEDLLRHLHDMSERPWCEYGRQRKPITPRQMAGLLKPFGIVAGQVWKEETNKRGYTSEQFSSVWARYLSASPLEATESASFSDFPSARDDQPLADGNPPKTTESASSSTLADRNPLCAEVGPICAHCGRLIDASDGYTAASSGEVLHNACVDAWLKDTR
jgi:putative DNA primase/helicase